MYANLVSDTNCVAFANAGALTAVIITVNLVRTEMQTDASCDAGLECTIGKLLIIKLSFSFFAIETVYLKTKVDYYSKT